MEYSLCNLYEDLCLLSRHQSTGTWEGIYAGKIKRGEIQNILKICLHPRGVGRKKTGKKQTKKNKTLSIQEINKSLQQAENRKHKTDYVA